MVWRYGAWDGVSSSSSSETERHGTERNGWLDCLFGGFGLMIHGGMGESEGRVRRG